MGSIPWEIQELGNELVFYNPNSGDVHCLNETAAIIWKKASKGADNEELLAAMQEAYPETGKEQLQEDLNSTLKQLKDLGLIE